MKISKNQLMEIIEEELKILTEEVPYVDDPKDWIIKALDSWPLDDSELRTIVKTIDDIIIKKTLAQEPLQREPQDRGGLERGPRPGATSPPPGPRPRDPLARKPSKRGQAMTIRR